MTSFLPKNKQYKNLWPYSNFTLDTGSDIHHHQITQNTEIMEWFHYGLR